MIEFKFKEDRDFEAFGVKFPKGEYVEVLAPSVIAKLIGNPHFISRGEAPNEANVEDVNIEVEPKKLKLK